MHQRSKQLRSLCDNLLYCDAVLPVELVGVVAGWLCSVAVVLHRAVLVVSCVCIGRISAYTAWIHVKSIGHSCSCSTLCSVLALKVV